MPRIFLFALLLGLGSISFAQPDTTAPGLGTNPPEQPPIPNADTPENAVRKFVADLDGNLEIGLAADVVGGRVGFYGTDDWEWAFNNLYALQSIKNLKIDELKVENQTDSEATVSLAYHRAHQEGEPTKVTLQLRRNAEILAPAFGFLKSAWRVVPPTTEEVLASSFGKLSPFQLAATLAVRDPHLLPLIQQQRGMTQLKQLGLGAAQFAQDYDEFFAYDDAARERALRPYLKNDSLFLIAGTKDEKWHFNDNLSTKSLSFITWEGEDGTPLDMKLQTKPGGVTDPAHTVMFYDGSAPDNDHLNFRFADKTLICFVDGHVAALGKDELQNLIWKL